MRALNPMLFSPPPPRSPSTTAGTIGRLNRQSIKFAVPISAHKKMATPARQCTATILSAWTGWLTTLLVWCGFSRSLNGRLLDIAAGFVLIHSHCSVQRKGSNVHCVCIDVISHQLVQPINDSNVIFQSEFLVFLVECRVSALSHSTNRTFTTRN